MIFFVGIFQVLIVSGVKDFTSKEPNDQYLFVDDDKENRELVGFDDNIDSNTRDSQFPLPEKFEFFRCDTESKQAGGNGGLITGSVILERKATMMQGGCESQLLMNNVPHRLAENRKKRRRLATAVVDKTVEQHFHWQQMLELLKLYQREKHVFPKPNELYGGKQLGLWCQNQRQHFRQLCSLGFDWGDHVTVTDIEIDANQPASSPERMNSLPTQNIEEMETETMPHTRCPVLRDETNTRQSAELRDCIEPNNIVAVPTPNQQHNQEITMETGALPDTACPVVDGVTGHQLVEISCTAETTTCANLRNMEQEQTTKIHNDTNHSQTATTEELNQLETNGESQDKNCTDVNVIEANKKVHAEDSADTEQAESRQPTTPGATTTQTRNLPSDDSTTAQVNSEPVDKTSTVLQTCGSLVSEQGSRQATEGTQETPNANQMNISDENMDTTRGNTRSGNQPCSEDNSHCQPMRDSTSLNNLPIETFFAADPFSLMTRRNSHCIGIGESTTKLNVLLQEQGEINASNSDGTSTASPLKGTSCKVCARELNRKFRYCDDCWRPMQEALSSKIREKAREKAKMKQREMTSNSDEENDYGFGISGEDASVDNPAHSDWFQNARTTSPTTK